MTVRKTSFLGSIHTLGFFPSQNPRPKVKLRFYHWSTRFSVFGTFRRYSVRAPLFVRRIVTYWHIVYMRFYRA